MSPRVVLFDAGGTLVTMDADAVGDVVEPHLGTRPAQESLRRAHYQAMHELAVQPTGWQGTEAPDWWHWWLARNLELAGLAPSPEAVAALVATSGLWRCPLPGSREGVAAVRAAGYRVGVVSNADGRVADDLAAAGFDGLFEAIVDSTLVGVSKPDPAIFTHAFEALGAEAADTWYVGDSVLFDVAGARAAGLAEVVVIDPYGLVAHEPAVRSLTELPGLLAARG